MMQSKFGIAVSSEVMAILSIFNGLADFKKRLNEIVVAYDKKGNPVTTGDLEVGNAMIAWMVPSINPTLMQSVEKQPVLRARRPLRQHRRGPVLHRRRPDRPEAL